MKSSGFTTKGTSLRESTSFEHFACRLGSKPLYSHPWGGGSQKDVSPLTQGLNYTVQPVI